MKGSLVPAPRKSRLGRRSTAAKYISLAKSVVPPPGGVALRSPGNRRERKSQRPVLAYQVPRCSPATFVTPYIVVGKSGVSSVTGSGRLPPAPGGIGPKTAMEEGHRRRGRGSGRAAIVSRASRRLPMLTAQQRAGSLSPVALSTAVRR